VPAPRPPWRAGHVFAYDRPRSDDRAVADLDSAENLRPGADPNIAADADQGGLPPLLSDRRAELDAVVRIGEVAAWRDQRILADLDRLDGVRMQNSLAIERMTPSLPLALRKA
jgi:hypothetical protein